MTSPNSATPPPLPVSASNTGAAWQPSLDAPILLDGRVVNGTGGLTLAGVEQEVLRGGRFVLYSYNFSFVVLSFKRASSIYFLRSGSDGAGKAFGYSLISLLLGPWGIPWGLFWTPVCIVSNLRGGKDITAFLLEGLLGPERAAQVMAVRRKKTPGWGMMTLRTLFIAAPLAVIFSIYMSVQSADAAETKLAAAPGFVAFKTADDMVKGALPLGNTTQAVTVAKDIAAGMKTFLDQAANHSGSKKVPSHQCGVWCELRDDQCIVLLKVPDLRHYDSAAQKILADAAWQDSLACLQNHFAVKPGMPLTVGLRGDYLYDTVLTGKMSLDPEAKPESRVTSSASREKLIESFR